MLKLVQDTPCLTQEYEQNKKLSLVPKTTISSLRDSYCKSGPK